MFTVIQKTLVVGCLLLMTVFNVCAIEIDSTITQSNHSVVVSADSLEALVNGLGEPAGASSRGNLSFTAHNRTVQLGEIGSNQFSFEEADAVLSPYVAEALPPVDQDKLQKYLVTIGNAHLSDDVKNARNIIDKAITAGNFISQLAGGDLVKLPITMKKMVNNVEVIIVFNSIILKPAFAELEIIARITTPQKSYDRFGNPTNKTELFFSAEGVKFSQEGGFVGEVKLNLISQVAFELGGAGNSKTAVVLLPAHDVPEEAVAIPNGGGAMATPPSDPLKRGTFITIDCDGVKQFGIEANIYFSRDWILPVNSLTNQPFTGESENVSGHIQAIVHDWNNILFENVSISNFCLTKKQDVFFALGNANVDMSDYANPTTAQFPTGYLDYLNGNTNFWRGVYIGKLSITLPKVFKKNCGGASSGPAGSGQSCGIIIQGENMIMDPLGVSGKFSIIGQAPLVSGGKMDKAWNWSLDEVEMTLDKSEFAGFKFSGQISIPIAAQNTALGYFAEYNMTENEYIFSLAAFQPMKFPVFKAANVVLVSGTRLDIKVENDEFVPEIHLYGSMSIGDPNAASGDVNKVKVPKLVFENLVLTTKAPYISIGDLPGTLDGDVGLIELEGNGGGGQVMNFPITVNQISFANEGPAKIALGFNININLLDELEGGVNAVGYFKILGKMVEDGSGAHRWVFDKFNFLGANITLKIPKAMLITGEIVVFEDHPVYGDGFGAGLKGSFVATEDDFSDAKLKADVGAVFGKKDGYNYFMVDGFAKLNGAGVALPPTPYFLNGFGGGASYHMKPVGYVDDPSQLMTGQDATGLIYEPSKQTGLGIKISTSFTDHKSTTGTLSLLIRFSPSMGLQNIMFWGVLEIAMDKKADAATATVDENKIKAGQKQATKSEPAKAQEDKLEAHNKENAITAHVGISLDFTHDFTFHGFADVYMNMKDIKLTGRGTFDMLIQTGPQPVTDAAGAPVTGPNGDPQTVDPEWHLYVGGYNDGTVTYDDFFTGNKAELYPVQVGIQYSEDLTVTAKCYFLTGNRLPGPPPVDPVLIDKFGLPTNGNGATNNRGELNTKCAGKTPANGLGLAFGAQAQFSVQKQNDSDNCLFAYKFRADGGVGFDLSLIKYAANSTCNWGTVTGETQGIKGFRATGRIWAYIDVNGSNAVCIPLPSFGAGLMAQADVTNPSFFSLNAYIDFIVKLEFDVTIPMEDGAAPCGRPCLVD